MGRPTRRRAGERGVGLIETLGAFFILFVVTLAVLQLFSLSTAVNMGSLARTELSYRAQRTIEVIRIQDALSRQTTVTNNSTCCPLAAGTSVTIPVTTTDPCKAFWGSAGFGVWDSGAPYSVTYAIVGVTADPNDKSVGGTEVQVTVQPNKTGPNRFLGASALVKAVRYVAKLQ
jgi:Tfp pilus assembly protein PilV